ncbi:thiamine pyrophosphate-dependent enzyme [Natronocalculus amylovorans]|uniref:thiamine pyrophosphate-dependent enzyme n=1 Tax=Natronocalculus amylovorans TaxID=2917812 RepID=UPI003CCD62E3
MVRVLDFDGVPLADATVPDIDDETFVGLYADMRAARRFDERAISLQRQGRMGTYASLAGQEGSQVGSTYALSDDDWLFYQYREHGTLFAREFPPEHLAYWMGHEAGNGAVADANVFPLNIGIASHLPHAVGWGMAAQYKGDESLSVAHFGEGSTSEGDFHEALNFAGVFDTATLFICHNNGWAISIPAEDQTASESFAMKAEAYGFPGIRVDGMDPLAAYQVTKAAADVAHSPPEGRLRSTLIEMVEYRYGAHTTADDPTVYRDNATVEQWKQRDPIERLEAFLRETGRLDDEMIASIENEIDDEIADLISVAESFEADPADLFADMYATQPAEIQSQEAAFLDSIERHGKSAFLREE